MKEVKKLLSECYVLWDLYQENPCYSEKQYGYLNDEIEDVEVGCLKTTTNDSDYAERLRKDKFVISKEESINLMEHRIKTIYSEIRELNDTRENRLNFIKNFNFSILEDIDIIKIIRILDNHG